MLRALLIGGLAFAQEPAPTQQFPDEEAALAAIAQAAEALKNGDASTPAGTDANKKQIRLILNAAAVFPQSLTVNVKAAEALIAAGEFKPALIPAERALLIRRSPSTLTQRGTALYGTQNYTGAIDDCKAALKLNPRHFGAFSLCKMAEGRASATSKDNSQSAEDSRKEPTSTGSPSANTAESGANISASASNRFDAPPDPLTAIRPARDRLRSSETGRQIDDFMAAKSVQFKYGQMPAATGAIYDPKSNTIYLPLQASEANPVALATTLAHEGFHAIQIIDRGVTRSAEVEQEAYFRGLAVYHEMLQAGAPKLSDIHWLGLQYGQFSKRMAAGDVAGSHGDGINLYRSRRTYALETATKAVPQPLKLMLQWALEVVDPEGLQTMETIDEQKGKIWNIHRRKALKWTASLHEKDLEWQELWAREHRKEFSSVR